MEAFPSSLEGSREIVSIGGGVVSGAREAVSIGRAVVFDGRAMVSMRCEVVFADGERFIRSRCDWRAGQCHKKPSGFEISVDSLPAPLISTQI